MGATIHMLARSFRLPTFTNRDKRIFLFTIPFIVIIMNRLLFSSDYFSNWKVFGIGTLITFLVLCLLWPLLTWVAVTVRNRFRQDREMIKRLALTISIIVMLTWLAITAIFQLYDQLKITGSPLQENRYYWALIVSAIINVFVTFLHEGFSGFEKWKATLIETEELKKEYLHSQLLGLKSQVNPHFLFNSLNSLSCLIAEDPNKAEKFLNEMSKVYRYLLRSNEEQLVTLETELKFAESYFYLLKARHGDGVSLKVDINKNDRKKLLPPLTLQILFENAFQLNMISKDQPLKIHISSVETDWLEIRNTIQKKVTEDEVSSSGLENIGNKYRLLCQQCISINENNRVRTVRIPLLSKAEIPVA